MLGFHEPIEGILSSEILGSPIAQDDAAWLAQSPPLREKLIAVGLVEPEPIPQKLKARGMATTTIHKRIQFARQFMHDAVDWKIIDENPFLKVKTQKSSVKVNEFVPREMVDKLMKKANPVWQVILGLSRYGGLRTPSETLSLRWEDIDWEMARNRGQSPQVRVRFSK